MSELLTFQFDGTNQANLPGGLFFKLTNAPVGPVDITFYNDRKGVVHRALNAPAGYELGPLHEGDRFHAVVIASTYTQQIKYILGDERADITGIELELSQLSRAGGNKISTYTYTVQDTARQAINQVPDPGTARGYYLKAHPTNTEIIELLDDGASDGEGYPLQAGEEIYIPHDSNQSVAALQLQARHLGSGGTQKLCCIWVWDNQS